MSDTPRSPAYRPDRPPPDIDETAPHPARVWNYWVGGEDNFAADRAVGDRFGVEAPDLVDTARDFRRFVTRAVRYLTVDVGLRQFLDIGAGIPTSGSTHHVAQRAAPDCRVVYVDNDPAVLAYGRARLSGTPEGVATYVPGDLHNPASILFAARSTLDFAQPIGLVLSGVLGHVGLTAGRSVVRRLMYELVPESHLVTCDGAAGVASAHTQPSGEVLHGTGWAGYRLRTPEQIAGFFDGLQLLEPGVVPCRDWRPDGGASNSSGDAVHAVGGVGRKQGAGP